MKEWFKMVLSSMQKFSDEGDPHGRHLSAIPPHEVATALPVVLHRLNCVVIHHATTP